MHIFDRYEYLYNTVYNIHYTDYYQTKTVFNLSNIIYLYLNVIPNIWLYNVIPLTNTKFLLYMTRRYQSKYFLCSLKHT